MTTQQNLGGSFTLPGTTITLNRLGYGAMQLAGPGVFGPPRDRPEELAHVMANEWLSALAHVPLEALNGAVSKAIRSLMFWPAHSQVPFLSSPGRLRVIARPVCWLAIRLPVT